MYLMYSLTTRLVFESFEYYRKMLKLISRLYNDSHLQQCHKDVFVFNQEHKTNDKLPIFTRQKDTDDDRIRRMKAWKMSTNTVVY
jgi:hypothetical protein